MAFGIFLTIHIIVAFFLVIVILIQSGRGGGLGEALGGSGGSSLFGSGGNTVMTRITAIGASVFMITCLLLAKLSTQRGRSVIERIPITLPDILPAGSLPAPPVDGAPGTPAGADTPAGTDATAASVTPAIGVEETVIPVSPPAQPSDSPWPPD